MKDCNKVRKKWSEWIILLQFKWNSIVHILGQNWISFTFIVKVYILQTYKTESQNFLDPGLK